VILAEDDVLHIAELASDIVNDQMLAIELGEDFPDALFDDRSPLGQLFRLHFRFHDHAHPFEGEEKEHSGAGHQDLGMRQENKKQDREDRGDEPEGRPEQSPKFSYLSGRCARAKGCRSHGEIDFSRNPASLGASFANGAHFY
jgi:hypothetical protein